MLASALQIDVLNTFEQLSSHLNEWCFAINTETKLPAWLASDIDAFSTITLPDDALSHREKAVFLFSQLEFLAEQQPRSILLTPGVIGASEATIELTEKLNQSKAAFKQAILTLKQHKGSLKDPSFGHRLEKTLSAKRDPKVAHCLTKTGLARLHLKQCYRVLPILEKLPKKISWTWANTKAIRKISISDAEALLLKKPMTEVIQFQLDKLGHLSPNEKLAIVQELAPHIRTNILYYDGSRQMVKGAVPLLYHATEQSVLPEIVALKPKDAITKPRERRSDTKLEQTAFLPAIRAHRYVKSPEPA